MWRYRIFFSLLYFIQGAVLAYIVNFQMPYLAAHGISKTDLGLFTSLLLLPFILKVFLGMLSDRVPFKKLGARKPYMLFGLGLFTLSYLGLNWIDPGSEFMRFAVFSWLASLGLAWFDTCADGWAVDVADEKEQSFIQASMIAGKSLGLICMSLAFGEIASRYGFGPVFLILSGMAVVLLLVVAGVKYEPRALTANELVLNWSDLLKPFYVFFALFGTLYSIASFGTDGLMTLHLSEVAHVGSVGIGVYGMSRGLGALFGAVLYAIVTRKIGLKRAQILSLLFLGLGCLSAVWNTGWPVWLAGFLWGSCWGFQETAYVTLAMRYAQGAWAATFFAISMIFGNLGTSIGEALGAPMVPHIGYTGVFVSFAILAWACLGLMPFVFSPAVD